MNAILQVACFFLLLYLLATREKGGGDGRTEKKEKVVVVQGKALDGTEAVQGDPASVQDGEVGLGNE